ncbi:hypothetical protein B0H14DRAFT_2561326 [Mycena olivaceomarginata]|nr:hypothetical protein B0H14DRAFT_2561326 [Mycena olivaceomarginata]
MPPLPLLFYVPLSLEPCKIQHIYATGVVGHRSLYLNPRSLAGALFTLYNTAQYGATGCELSNLLVNSASYSASSFSFIDVCTEGGVQGLWYYVYGTGPLALVVGAILILVNDPHIARLKFIFRTQVRYKTSLCTGLELWKSGTQTHWT